MEVDEKESGCKLDHYVKWVPVRRRFAVDSAFFAAGNVERELLAKQISLEITEEEKFHIGRLEEEQLWQVHCPIVGCGAKLKGLGDLESHYLSRHTATCSVCERVFPTTRLLNLHVSETHDSFFQAKVARNYPMYECLVEGCSAHFHSDPNRHQHLVDKHSFPRSFRFHVKQHASQKHRQRQKAHQSQNGPKQLTKKQRSQAQTVQISTRLKPPHGTEDQELGKPQCETINQEMQMDVDELTSAVSRLSTASKGNSAPSDVSFGHRRGRGLAFVPGQSTRGSGWGRGRSRGRGTQPPTAGTS